MDKLNNIIESILFVSGKEVEENFIIDKLAITKQQFSEAVSELMTIYSGDCGIHLLRFNKKLQFCTNPAYSKNVESVLNPIRERELTNALLETLAIVAYKQPITRLEIEEIRTLDSTYSVQTLVRLGLIEAVGRKETIGKPILFGTSDEFLKRFNLAEITDLPEYDEFLERLQDISVVGSTPDVVEVEKPMFGAEPVPEFLEGEQLDTVE